MNQSYQPDTDKLLTELNNGVLTISFNRPEAMNALHPEMLTGVGALVDHASADDAVCAIVLQGEGRAFSAGVDLKVLQDKEGRLEDGPGFLHAHCLTSVRWNAPFHCIGQPPVAQKRDHLLCVGRPSTAYQPNWPVLCHVSSPD